MTPTGDSRLKPRHPALELIDVSNMRGLEFGPMYRPLVAKSNGDIHYLDVYSTEELQRRYREDPQAGPHVDEIVEIDFVLTEGLTLAQTTETRAPFDYVIASHVIEHVANPLGWFKETSEILASGGLISLTIPDKRFSFDVNRELTRPHDWIEWHMRDLRAPSYGQIFDHYAHIVHEDGLVDTAGLWAGTADYSDHKRPNDAADPDVSAYSICLQRRESGDYIDAHAGVYTPASFISLLELSIKLGLFEFEVAHFVPTPRDCLEFYVTLRFAPQSSQSDRLGSLRDAAAQLARAEEPESPPATAEHAPTDPPSGQAWMLVSNKERRAILGKRNLLRRLR